MNTLKNVIAVIGCILFLNLNVMAQKEARYFGEPVLTDSSSTLFMATRYNTEFLSTNKIAFWGDYYANLVAYNFQTDTYRKIFERDTFIESFKRSYSTYRNNTPERIHNITKHWIFLLVKTKDTNNSGRIDEKDPSVLFAVSTDGVTVKQLTTETENVVSFDNFEQQGFFLIKVQRDTNNDKSFKAEDKDFYFRKLNLSDLTFGNNIEIK